MGGKNDPCDAVNPCTVGSCEAGVGCVYDPLPDGTACSMACYVQSSCFEGACKVNPDSAIQCPQPSAFQPCVAELLCDPTSGECTVEVPKGTGSTCDTDGNLCSVELCTSDGGCEATGETNTCLTEKQLVPCDNWTCHPKTGECVESGFAGEVSCDDGNACTANDTCAQDDFGFSSCKGTPLVVDDNNPCTDDACTDGVITHKPLDQLPCDPEDPCSEDGLCVEGACEATTPCACEVDADCPQPEDLCAGQRICDPSGDVPICAIDPATVVSCGPATKACHTNTCVPALGACVEQPTVDGTPCDDGNVCSGGDSCQNGVCKPGAPVTCDDGFFCNGLETCDPSSGCLPGVASTVDDGVDCTLDTCDEDADTVKHTPVNASCDDGVFCNGAETCDLTQGCVSTGPVPVDDGLACTVDACHEATQQVSHIPDHSLCDNGLFCDGVETCDVLAGCQSGLAPTLDDGVACTVDACDDAIDTVTHTPVDASCDNGVTCDGVETCDVALGCLADPSVNMDDGVDCTLDLCDDVTGQIIHVPDHAACSDGVFCTGSEVCDVNQGCLPGTPPPVDDGIPCTVDSCDEETDTVIHVPDHASCQNGLFCDGEEVCNAAMGCIQGAPPDLSDGVPCTVDSCSEATDTILHTPFDGLCDNGLFCDGAETCHPLVGCQEAAAGPASDGLDCTIDSCDETTDTVTHTANHTICQNGLFCDGAEVCDLNLGCQPGPPVVVDDGLSCTQDICNEADQSVLHLPIDALCDDGLYCNGNETCDVIFDCQPGTPPNVSDGVACTVDSCDEANDGSVHEPSDALCAGEGTCIVGVCDALAGCSTELALDCCGNDILEDGELCDDGNEVAGDGCFDCKFESPRNCKEWKDLEPDADSGIFFIDPGAGAGIGSFPVWCDMVTDGGGWTIFMAASEPDLTPTIKTDIDPDVPGYFYMPSEHFETLAEPGMRVRAWAVEKPELFLECDFDVTGDTFKQWKAGTNCIQQMRAKADDSLVTIVFDGTGRGFLYSGFWDSIAPEDPIVGSEKVVFLKPNGFDGKWTVPGWDPSVEQGLISDYKDFAGAWTSDHDRRMVYAIR